MHLDESDLRELCKDTYDKAFEEFRLRRCNRCAYGKTSGDMYICDLGVAESKVWGNSFSFGCTKFKEDERISGI